MGWRILGPLQLQPAWSPSNPTESGNRIKGDRLVLFRKTPEGTELLSDGVRASAGDQIRIGYRAAGLSYGLILSIDGRGVVTRHFPRQEERATLLAPEGLVLLDHAYELDDAPGWERFYLVTGPKAFEIAPVLEAARRLAAAPGDGPPGALTLPADLDQSSLTLMKEVIR